MLRETLLYTASALLVLAAVLMITFNNPIYTVTFLCLCFILGAAIFCLMDFYFLGLTYIIVYVGAIAILFIFTVMMINLSSFLA